MSSIITMFPKGTALCISLSLGITALPVGYAQKLPSITYQSCPDGSDYADNKPVRLGSYDPLTLLGKGPTSSVSYCTQAAADPTEAPCAEHRVYLPAATQTLRPPLFVFLPGSSMEPDKHDLVLKMAAYAGYRTVGLSYDSRNNIELLCGSIFTPPSCSDPICHRPVRDEIITGEDQTSLFIVDSADSVFERLYTLLVGLYDEDLLDGTNDYAWDSYYLPMSDDKVNQHNFSWNNIIIAGFSQGAGHAAKIAKDVEVHGMIMLDGPGDACLDGASNVVAAEWLTAPWDASAERPRYGLMHEYWFSLFGAGAPVTWQALDIGLNSIANLDAIYQFPPAAAASTAQVPVTTSSCPNLGAGTQEHGSIAADGCMPKDATGGVEAKSPAKAHLFGPLLDRFCYACDAAACP